MNRRNRALTGVIVVVLHTMFWWMFTETLKASDEGAPRPAVHALLVTNIVAPHRLTDVVPLPQVKWRVPPIDRPTLTQVRFVDPDADLVHGVIAPASAPREDPARRIDMEFYAYQAGLVAGQAATVVLSIEVRADGTVGDVSVLNSSGNVAVDEEAIVYVHMLHWIPGSVNRHARAMRIRWPVTLRVASHTDVYDRGN